MFQQNLKLFNLHFVENVFNLEHIHISTLINYVQLV